MEYKRNSILAGSWYPKDSEKLRAEVQSYIDDADVPRVKSRAFALFSPHAGYAYSGPVMGHTFKFLQKQAEKYPIKTVFIVAFSHRGDGDGRVSVWQKGGWETPLGVVEVDEEAAEALVNSSPNIGFVQETHMREHSLEILLPFLQVAMGDDVRIVPISFSQMNVGEIETLRDGLARVLNGRNDAIVIASTDMSHYHSYPTAVKMDREAIDLVLDGDSNALLDALSKREVELCGAGPVVTVMELANMFGAEDRQLLSYGNSGDVPDGDSSRVVGYCSVVFNLPEGDRFILPEQYTSETPGTDDYSLTREEKIYLLQLARETIKEYVSNKRVIEPEKPKTGKLTQKAAVFVTLEKKGQLRGCIGQMIAQGPLYLSVRDMAISAAVNDHRFPQVTPSELENIDIEVSVLSPLKKTEDYKAIRLGIDGVYLVGSRGGSTRTGVFLPSVATDTGWDLDTFLGELCSQKAGLSWECYKNPATEFYTFTVLKFTEAEMGLK